MLVNFGEELTRIDNCLKDKVLYSKIASSHPSLNDYSRFSLGSIEQMEYVLSLIS